MTIQHNIRALNSHRRLGINNSSVSKSLEKLSSGFRINRAGDDAAGLAISEKMRGQIRGLGMAEMNTRHGIELIKTAEGGLNETHAILQRLRELAVQSSSGSYQDGDDREKLEAEYQSLMSEIDRIAEYSNFNGIKLLNGDLSRGGSAAQAGTSIPYNVLSTPASFAALGAEALSAGNVDAEMAMSLFASNSGIPATQVGSGTINTAAMNGIDYSWLTSEMQSTIIPQIVSGFFSAFPALGFFEDSTIGIGLQFTRGGSGAYITGGKNTDGAGGYGVSLQLTINLDYLDTLSNAGIGFKSAADRSQYENMLAHELTHAMMDIVTTNGMTSDTDRFPDWFREGMAQSVSGDMGWAVDLHFSSTDLEIKDALNFSAPGGDGTYKAGYLAVMYLAFLVESGSGGGLVRGDLLASGVNTILGKLASGSSLDQVIADYTKYAGLDDFAANVANDAAAYGFVCVLQGVKAGGGGGLLDKDLTTTDQVSNSALGGVTFLALDITCPTVINVYPNPSDYNANWPLGQEGGGGGAKTPGVSIHSDYDPGLAAVSPYLTININTSANTSNEDYEFNNGVLTIKSNKSFKIEGTGVATTNRIVVQSGVTADITLSNVNINTGGGAALDMRGATVSLYLEGSNTLTSTYPTRAGVETTGGSLTINGTGSLTAQGGYYGAGIGGGNSGNGGTITINSGTVTATGGVGVADIGGGMGAPAGVITINGGSITATSDYIGTGGIVKFGDTDMINDLFSVVRGQLQRIDGTPIYRTQITGATFAANTNVAYKIDGVSYSSKTDAGGNLYLYLPVADDGKLLELTIGGKNYEGLFSLAANHSNSLSLYSLPVLTSGGATRTADDEATLKFTSDAPGDYYYLVKDSGAPAPDESDVIFYGTSGGNCNTSQQTVNLTGLTSGAKDVYVVVEDANGTSNVLKITLPAYNAPPPPILSGGTVNRTSDNDATVRFNSDKSGNYFYVVQDSTDPSPSVNDVKNNGLTDSNTAGQNTLNLNALTSGDKKIFIVVENADGTSNLLEIAIPAYDPSKPPQPDLDSTGRGLVLQIGANGGADQRVTVYIENMDSKNIGIKNANGQITESVANTNISTIDNANRSINVLEGAINMVSGQRAELGAMQNRLEHTLNNLGVTKENLTASEAIIRDTDMAKEMMEFVKNNILQQAAQAMLAQANQLPQGVLQLLR